MSGKEGDSRGNAASFSKGEGRRLKIARGIGLVLLGTSSLASAQINQGADVHRVVIRPTIQLLYDSNVFRANDLIVVPPGRSRDDLRATPSLDLDISIPVGRQLLFLSGEVGYDFYVNNTQLNNARINLSGGADLRVLRTCSTKITGSYARRQSNFADIFATVVLPNTEERKGVDVQASCGGAIGFAPSIGYGHEEVSNSSPFFKTFDYRTDRFNGSLAYQRPSFGALAIYGNYARTAYPNRQFVTFPSFQTVTDGVQSYSAGVRFSRNIGSRINGSISIGYSWVDPKLFTVNKFRGASYELDLNLRPSERMQLEVLASRSAEVSNLANVSYSITDLYGLNGTYQLNRKARLTYGASYQTRDYRGSQQAGPFLPIKNDTLTQGSVGLAYDLGRRITLTSNFTQEKRTADNPFFNYISSRVMLGASLTF